MVNRLRAGGPGERAKALRLDDGSPVSREAHAGFYERRGVRFPPATHPIYAGWERCDFSSAEWAHPETDYVCGRTGPLPVAGRD